MNKNLKDFLLILTFFFLSSCNTHSDQTGIDRMNIEIEITYEFPEGGYAISWKDTLCSEFSEDWDYLQNRPLEPYCYIYNQKRDTLGYYRGLSSPRQFTYFQTTDSTDSIIDIEFSIGINHFSNFLAEQSQDYIDKFNSKHKEKINFEPISINLKKDINRKIEIVLVREDS